MKNVIRTVLAGSGIGVVGAGLGAGALAVLAIGFILKPLLAILIGWVVGHVVAWVAGGFVAGALSTIFHTSITASMLPSVFAGITLLASYFRHVVRTNDNGVKAQADNAQAKKAWEDMKKELRDSK
ncbi:hypothetical protein [Paenibacillus sp. NPDC057967]|uniref:hypothetical protein n=1 Tax=Paenibacillus sp. NPDC057967 TaxID=3346293 RepID=UPI0036DACB41